MPGNGFEGVDHHLCEQRRLRNHPKGAVIVCSDRGGGSETGG